MDWQRMKRALMPTRMTPRLCSSFCRRQCAPPDDDDEDGAPEAAAAAGSSDCEWLSGLK